jgi:glutamate N-acetyltransferase/amino-acid N-acetyltransferase
MTEAFKSEIARKSYLEAVDGGPCAVEGITCAGAHIGLKPNGEPDCALFVSEQPCKTAAFFTTNKLLGAHIPVFRETLKASRNRCRALLVNSKNANCATGEKGERDNLAVAATLASKLGVPPEMSLFCSTGVIGRPLPVGIISGGLDALVASLSKDGALSAARAILTTDTREKMFALSVKQGGKKYHIGGVAKGSGMIAPNMATMFAFIFTDADIPFSMLRSVAADCVDNTFNSVSVDGDMSPNDTALVMANGISGVKLDAKDAGGRERFREALGLVAGALAREIARDGEGATKLVSIEINGAASVADARRMARGIAESLLVKTAIFGGDPNWGRIVSAAATSGAALDPAKARLDIDGLRVYDKGRIADAPDNIFKGKEVTIRLDAGAGRSSARFWSCDLSYDYVKINAEYTT